MPKVQRLVSIGGRIFNHYFFAIHFMLSKTNIIIIFIEKIKQIIIGNGKVEKTFYNIVF